jgi:hypothetical protein
MANRLFCARTDEGLRFCVTTSLDSAIEQLGKTARYPMDEEVVEFWSMHDLQNFSAAEVARAFAVSHQTVSNWRRRAKAPTQTEMQREQRLSRTQTGEAQ